MIEKYKQVFLCVVSYAIGGFILGAATISNADPSVQIKTPLPTARVGAACGTIYDKIYVIGGLTKDGKESALVEVYTPGLDKWGTVAPMPTARAATAAAVIGQELYVMGGRNEKGILDSVEIYDAAKNTWRVGPSLSMPKWNLMAAALANSVFSLGGVRGAGASREALAEVESLDVEKGRWTKASPLPFPRQAAGITAMNGALLVAGGNKGAGRGVEATETTAVFDPTTNMWSTAASLSGPRLGAGAVTVGKSVYLISGALDGKTLEVVERLNAEMSNWTKLNLPIRPRTGACVAAVGGRIYLIGGMEREAVSGITTVVEEITLE